VAKAARTFKLAVGPGLNQFRDNLLERWPEIRYIEVMTEDNRGQRTGGNVRLVEDGREAADGEFTHVMVRLKTAELDIVDTLIAAGIANNRAEAIRWVLTASPNAPPTSSCGSTPATLNGSRASSNASSPGPAAADPQAQSLMAWERPPAMIASGL